jgi:hypothetical protein
MVVAEALGETFRTREKEVLWRRRVGESEAMLGVGMRANADREGDGLGEQLRVVVREMDEALRLLEEVRKVMCMAAGAAVG